MKQQTFDKATEYIDAIAAKLGVAAEHVYGILVKQMIVYGVMDVVLGIILMAVVYAMVRMTFRYLDDSEGFILMLTIPAGFTAAIFGLFGLYTGIGELINPEYYAIKELLDAIGGKQ